MVWFNKFNLFNLLNHINPNNGTDFAKQTVFQQALLRERQLANISQRFHLNSTHKIKKRFWGIW